MHLEKQRMHGKIEGSKCPSANRLTKKAVKIKSEKCNKQMFIGKPSSSERPNRNQSNGRKAHRSHVQVCVHRL